MKNFLKQHWLSVISILIAIFTPTYYYYTLHMMNTSNDPNIVYSVVGFYGLMPIINVVGAIVAAIEIFISNFNYYILAAILLNIAAGLCVALCMFW